MTIPRIQNWSNPEKLILLQGWRMNGLTVEQVASNIGIVKSTLYEWMKKNPNISNALKIGEEEALMIAENSLFTLVKKNNLGAIIFFLKNRSNGKWKDKNIEDTSGDMGAEKIAEFKERQEMLYGEIVIEEDEIVDDESDIKGESDENN